jgi:hypothetical protein
MVMRSLAKWHSVQRARGVTIREGMPMNKQKLAVFVALTVALAALAAAAGPRFHTAGASHQRLAGSGWTWDGALYRHH